jgi:hypothetical protein
MATADGGRLVRGELELTEWHDRDITGRPWRRVPPAAPAAPDARGAREPPPGALGRVPNAMKLQARDRTQLVVIAYETGLVTPAGP